MAFLAMGKRGRCGKGKIFWNKNVRIITGKQNDPMGYFFSRSSLMKKI
jgi:hypothetical protein